MLSELLETTPRRGDVVVSVSMDGVETPLYCARRNIKNEFAWTKWRHVMETRSRPDEVVLVSEGRGGGDHYDDWLATFERLGPAIEAETPTMGSPTPVFTKPIRILAKGRDADGKDYLLLNISAPIDESRRRDLSISDYNSKRGETESALRLPIVAPAARTEFLLRVQDALGMPDSFDVATHSGWFNGAFVLPNGEVIGWTGNALSRKIKAHFPPAAREFAEKYRVKGDLAGWDELCRLAEGNTRLMMSLALSFVGPLGDLIGGDPPMIQLVGAAELG